jgi:hypothetical protein
MSDLSSSASDLSTKPLSQWTPVDKVRSALVTAMANPQPGTDDFQRKTEPRVMRALVNSIGNDQIGFGSWRLSLRDFNDRVHVRQVEKKTAGDTSPLGTSDIARVFGTSIEAMTIAHTLHAERKIVSAQMRRVETSGVDQGTAKAALGALKTIDGSLGQAQSALGTLLHNNTLDRDGAQRVLWFAGEAEPRLERSGTPFARAQALIGALADHTEGKRTGLVKEADAQKGRLRTDPDAKGRMFAISATLGSYVIAAPALRDARASAAGGASAYLAATREVTALKFIPGSARQQGEVQSTVDPAKGIGERGGVAREVRLGL